MFLVTRTQVRPNTSIDFFGSDNPAIPPGTLIHIRDTYVVTGKQVNVERSVSEDGLTLIMKALWSSEEAFNEYKNDQIVTNNLINISTAYCEANGISLTLVSKEQL